LLVNYIKLHSGGVIVWVLRYIAVMLFINDSAEEYATVSPFGCSVCVRQVVSIPLLPNSHCAISHLLVEHVPPVISTGNETNPQSLLAQTLTSHTSVTFSLPISK
jgi:hypothetical protein